MTASSLGGWLTSLPLAAAAVDVQYERGQAWAALGVYSDLTMATLVSEHVAAITQVAPYEPGSLYKRELPCIQAVLEGASEVDLLIIDGYVTLDPGGRPGLGAHAARVLGVPVIGVAKTRFRSATHAVEVLRGSATRPLYVTASPEVGMSAAARIVAEMAGPHRVPAALARVDRLARTAAQRPGVFAPRSLSGEGQA